MSRNPFVDIGFPPDEAAVLHIRSQLVATLERHIAHKGWSRTEAAGALKVARPTVSNVISGNIEKLSTKFLIRIMVRAGLPLSIHVDHPPPGRRGARRPLRV